METRTGSLELNTESSKTPCKDLPSLWRSTGKHLSAIWMITADFTEFLPSLSRDPSPPLAHHSHRPDFGWQSWKEHPQMNPQGDGWPTLCHFRSQPGGVFPIDINIQEEQCILPGAFSWGRFYWMGLLLSSNAFINPQIEWEHMEAGLRTRELIGPWGLIAEPSHSQGNLPRGACALSIIPILVAELGLEPRRPGLLLHSGHHHGLIVPQVHLRLLRNSHWHFLAPHIRKNGKMTSFYLLFTLKTDKMFPYP